MKKGCMYSGIVIFALLSIALAYYFYQQNNKDPFIYKKVKPKIEDVLKKTVATGSVKPRKEVNIKPQVSGVVEKLYVEAGQLVSKGQKLAKIKLVPSEVNINNAQSSVELARIRYKESQRELERQKQVNTQNLDVNQSKLQYEVSKVEEERQKKLFNDGVISQQEYQNFKVDMDVKQTAYQNAQILSGNNLKQFTADVDIRKQELEAAINNLSLLREGATKNSRQVSNVVTSTVSGMILELPVEEGSSVIERNTFNEGTSIATIADMTSLIFEGKVDESDVGKLTEGMPLVLTVGAIVDEKFDALLEYISPKGVVEEGTVKFEIRADITPREDIFLRAGYSANADIILGKKEQVVTINERDVIYSNDSTFVEVATGDQEFEKREVELGLSDGIIVEVVNGLDTITEIKMRQDEKAEEVDEEEN